MMPPVVTTDTLQNQNQKPIIQFKLYDPITKEGFKHVTYYITIEKDGKKLLSDWFHDHKGDLKIEMKPSDAEQNNCVRGTRSHFRSICRIRKQSGGCNGPNLLRRWPLSLYSKNTNN